MANILESGFGVLNPTYGSLTKTNFDSEEASFFSQMRKKKPKNMRINAENNEFRRKKCPYLKFFLYLCT
jgi:hypothetical protein